jgi:hypothetical protein
MAFLVLFGVLGINGCYKGPAEKAGEAIDNAGQDIRDGARDLKDKVKDGK